ncbi:MAG: hypothetical protein QM784_21685 [Polyangiaceae bacterium]
MTLRTINGELADTGSFKLVSDDENYERNVPVALSERLSDGRFRIRFGAIQAGKNYSLTYYPKPETPQLVFQNVPVEQINCHGRPITPPAPVRPPRKPNEHSLDRSAFDSWLLEPQ